MMDARRNSLCEQPLGRVMQPTPVSLVVGEKGSGVSTLLDAYRERADTRDTLILDGPARTWDTDDIGALLPRHRESGHASIVLAADNLQAPRHLLQALAENPDLAATYRLDAVTGVAGAASSLTLTEATGGVCAGSDGTAEGEEARGSKVTIDPELRRFFATADRIILTHTDRVRPGAVRKIAAALKSLNPPVPILRGRNGDIGPARLVDSGLFDPVTGSVDIDRWLCEAAFNFEATRRGGSATGLNLPESPLARLNNEIDVRFFAVTIDQPLDGAVLSVFLKLLMADSSTGLLRLKGIVATEDHPDRPALIDGRDHLIQPLLWLETWPTADRRGRLVFNTADTSEDWIRTLLTTLSDQLKLQELQMAMVEKVG